MSGDQFKVLSLIFEDKSRSSVLLGIFHVSCFWLVRWNNDFHNHSLFLLIVKIFFRVVRRFIFPFVMLVFCDASC